VSYTVAYVWFNFFSPPLETIAADVHSYSIWEEKCIFAIIHISDTEKENKKLIILSENCREMLVTRVKRCFRLQN